MEKTPWTHWSTASAPSPTIHAEKGLGKLHVCILLAVPHLQSALLWGRTMTMSLQDSEKLGQKLQIKLIFFKCILSEKLEALSHILGVCSALGPHNFSAACCLKTSCKHTPIYRATLLDSSALFIITASPCSTKPSKTLPRCGACPQAGRSEH